MGSWGHVLIFATIFFCLFLQVHSQAEAILPFSKASSEKLNLPTSICKKSNDFKFCLHTLKSYPKISSVTTIRSLADVALEIARKETTNMRDFFTGVLNKDHTNPSFKSSLTLCVNYFNIAAGFFNLHGLKSGTASLDVGYALNNAESCQNNLVGNGAQIESIQARIQNWKKFYSIAHAAIVAVENAAHPLPEVVLSQAEAIVPSTKVPFNLQNLLTGICKKSNDLQFCLHTLESCPQISSATNTMSLADVALEIARKETTNMRNFFTGMLNNKQTKPAFKPSLKLCVDYFNKAIGFFNLNGLKGGTAGLDVSYALNNAQSCQNILPKNSAHIDSIQAKIQNWKNVYSIAYAAVIAAENSTPHSPKHNV